MRVFTANPAYFASLDDDRLQGDVSTDQLVHQLFPSLSTEVYEKLCTFLKNPAHRALPDMDHEVRQALEQFLYRPVSLPLWANRGKMKLAQKLFSFYGAEMTLLVFAHSLPYLFCMPGTCRSLSGYSSGQATAAGLQKNILKEVNLFLKLLSMPGFVEGEGDIFLFLKKRRLHYALARQHWQKDERLGSNETPEIPFNQEDLMAFPLVFGAKVIEGLSFLGIHLSEAEREAYIHFWNVVANLLGGRETLLPLSFESATVLAQDIFEHQAGPAPEGKAYADECVKLFQNLLPEGPQAEVPQVLMAQLGGDVVAGLLKLEVEAEERARLGKELGLPSLEFQWGVAGSLALRHLAHVAAQHLMEGLCQNKLTEIGEALKIPEETAHQLQPLYKRTQQGRIQIRTLEETLKHLDDQLHFYLQAGDQRGYFVLHLRLMVVKLMDERQNQKLDHQAVMEETLARMASGFFMALQKPPGRKDEHDIWYPVTHTFDQGGLTAARFLQAGTFIQLFYELPLAFLAAAKDEIIPYLQDDFHRFVELFGPWFENDLAVPGQGLGALQRFSSLLEKDLIWQRVTEISEVTYPEKQAWKKDMARATHRLLRPMLESPEKEDSLLSASDHRLHLQRIFGLSLIK